MQAIAAQNRISDRATVLFDDSLNVVHRRADRIFAWLMIAQWIAGIVAALWISPQTWSGGKSQTHWHVWIAIFLGGALTSLPVYFAHAMPGRTLTRHTIAVAQVLFSALLVHLTGGRIETHFHVFGSLAFLAFYRDWRVLLTATVVVAADHATRGMFFPQSVFGILVASPWRWIEHAGWVLFEDLFLFISMHQSTRDMMAVAAHRADLEVGLTERTLAEHAVRAAEEKYRSIFENAVEGIYQTTPKGDFLAVNPAAARILGFSSPNQILGTTERTSYGYVDPLRHREFMRLIEEQSVVNAFESEVYRPDGSKV